MNISISMITQEELKSGTFNHLPGFDHTKLAAVNTCPKWGVIRYGHHKTFAYNSRAMALEAGEACHQVFAAARCFDLAQYGDGLYGSQARELAVRRALEMFGVERGGEFASLCLNDNLRGDEDERVALLRGCLHVLETSGFYDDPSDKRRTIDKLSEACIAYLDRYEFGVNVPYVSDGFVGIEVPFNLLVRWTSVDGREHSCRFTGRMDGVHCRKNNLDDPMLQENKTASRLNDAWEQSFETSHQVTGYLAACRAYIGKPVSRARIYGLSIPQPRLADGSGVSVVTVRRAEHQFDSWAKWFIHSAEMMFSWMPNPTEAPMYTVSCNRYFRPCSFIPLCAADPEEQKTTFEEQMVLDEWNVLQEKAGD
jgi:hypothetical protein